MAIAFRWTVNVKRHDMPVEVVSAIWSIGATNYTIFCSRAQAQEYVDELTRLRDIYDIEWANVALSVTG